MSEEKKSLENSTELSEEQIDEVSGGIAKEPFCYACKICGMKFYYMNRRLNYEAHMKYEHGQSV